jgi:transposase-like protein
MKYRPRKFSDSFRRRVVHEYLTTDITQKELQSKYDIKGHNNISRWCDKFEHELKSDSSKNDTLGVMKSKDHPKDFKKLTERIKELENALEEAELRAIAYKKLVENTEKELGIRLPKKSFTKRSKS